MASFSPSPAPRRPSRLQQIAHKQTPLRRKVNVIYPSPSFATPVPSRGHSARPASDDASGSTAMDLDEEDGRVISQKAERIFAQSDELLVTFYSHLPVEVKQTLKNADVYADIYSGEIDTATGFALVVSAQTCFVWQHAQAVRGTPTCYIFSCPQDGTQSIPPFHSLVPYGQNREPGLILVSIFGEIRFWDNIGIGLAGGDHFSTSSLELDEGENITTFVRSDAYTYIVSSTTGRIFRLTLSSSAGRYQLSSHSFARPTPSLSLSRFIPSIFSSLPSSNSNSSSLEPGNVSAVALGQRSLAGGLEVWALVDTRVQKWDVKPEGWEEALIDEDIADVIRSLLRSTFNKGVSDDDSDLDLELLDLKVDSEGKLVVLISYAGLDDDTSMSVDLSGIRRIYAVVQMSVNMDVVSADTVSSVPYQSTAASGAPMHPRIQLVLGGSLVCVQFGDAVAFCARDSQYRDRLALRSISDRTLGVGVIENDSTLLILTATTMIKSYIDMDKVAGFDPETGKANLIKSIMTQAILYGPNDDNPLNFSFPPDVDEEGLMVGAQRLSHAILASDPELVRKNHDLGGQFTSRRERLGWLIQFINDNAALPKMSQRSRQRLATDAEKLCACHQLWDEHGELLSTSPPHSILVDAIVAYMNENDDSYHDDVIRAFFRNRAQEIGILLSKVKIATLEASQDVSRGVLSSLPEANRIVLTLLNSAFEFRKDHLALYGVTLPMINPWTSKPAIIDIVLELFDASKKVSESSRDTERDIAKEPISQLPHLAAALFACISERLEWLESPVGMNEPGNEAERNDLEQRFALLRPEVLETLRKLGFTEEAFALAERYHDFSSLVALCHKSKVYPPSENPNAVRIEEYMEMFKYEFAKELYNWCIQHGELRVMFAEGGESHGRYKDWYFAENPKPAISWIHDLENKRYGATADALLSESKVAGNLEARHFMLSVGKLAHLAQSQESAETTLDQNVMDVFHDELDFVSVHESLLRELNEALDSSKTRKSLDAKIDSVVKVKAKKLGDYKVLSRVFKRIVRDLLQGKALSTEDVVDVLTLKDNEDKVEDYTIALQLLAGVKNLPEVRRMSAFRTVWRRILLHDDWHTIRRTTNVTDAEITDRLQGTALYHALCMVLANSDTTVEGYDLSPRDCYDIPNSSIISSRWPGMAQDEMDGLELDYGRESDSVRALGLEVDVYQRVREIAAQDVDWEE